MPQAGPALAALGQWLGTIAWGKVALDIAISTALSYAATKLTADNFDTGLNLSTQQSGNLVPIRLVYGTGTLAGIEVFKQSAKVDADNADLHFALVLAGHECSDIVDMWIDDTLIESGIDLDWTNHRVATGKYGIAGTGYPVSVWKHLGTSSQTVDTELNGVYPTLWDAAHTLKGVTYAVVRYRAFSKTTALFEGGPPTTARFRVDGYKTYDPRLDSTNGGSGSQRLATPSTWTFNACGPLALAHFLCFNEWGPLWDSAWIDWASVITAANASDATVPIPDTIWNRWDFTNTADGWIPSGITASTSSTVWTLDATTTDPIIRHTVDFKGEDWRYVRVRIRRTAGSGWDGRCYYTTQTHGESASFYKGISDTTSGTASTITFDMWALTAGSTDWQTSRITGLRLDFGSTAADTFEIDWIEVGSDASRTQKRFTCNGVLNAGSDFMDNVKALLSSFRGTLCPNSDKWTIQAGVYTAPDFTISEKDLADGISMEAQITTLDRFNTVKVLYIDPANSEVQGEVGGITDSSYLDRDNGYELVKQINAPMCNDFYLAQRLGMLELHLGNQQKVITFPGNMRCLQAVAMERVNLNIAEWSFANKVALVEGFEFRDMDGVTLTLREDSSGAWSDPIASTYKTRGPNGILINGDPTISAPTGFTVTPGFLGNTLRWINPSLDSEFTAIQVYASDTSAWSGATLVFSGRVAEYFHRTDIEQWYWLRSMRGDILSLRNPDSDTSTIHAKPNQREDLYTFVETFSDNNLVRFNENWIVASDSAPAAAIITETGTPPGLGGTYVLQAGNNSGANDQFATYLRPGLAMPIEINVLYRVVFHVRRQAGTAPVFLGVTSWAQDRVTSLATLWYAANNVSPGDTGWHTYVGYFKCDGSSSGTDNSGVCPSTAPGFLHPSTHWVSPYCMLNYQGASASGQAEWSYCSVSRVGAKAEVPTEGIVLNGTSTVYSVSAAGGVTVTKNIGTTQVIQEILYVSIAKPEDGMQIALEANCRIGVSAGTFDVAIWPYWFGGTTGFPVQFGQRVLKNDTALTNQGTVGTVDTTGLDTGTLRIGIVCEVDGSSGVSIVATLYDLQVKVTVFKR